MARREGIEVDSVTLWLFGGVAEFKDRFASAGAEFRVALSGPLVSIGLSVLFVAIALAGLPSAVDGAAAWLGYINLILAAFNLLPASPLDGGRVLHAALWRAKGDYAWATRVASEIGQGFGYLFIALGLVMFVFQGSFSGAWLAFIGWYLLQGAKAEARYVADRAGARRIARSRFDGAPPPLPSTPTGRLGASWTTSPRRTGSLPTPSSMAAVRSDCSPFASVAAVPRSEWETRPADTMISLDEVPLLTEDETAVDALAELSAPSANRGLVVDNGHLAGLLSITDLVRALEVGRRPAKADRRLRGIFWPATLFFDP